MSEKALKWIINISGIVCLYAFIAIRVMPMFNLVLHEKYEPGYWENVKYGELYYFNFIKHFREQNLPKHNQKYRHSEKHPSLADADIVSFGDSFFDFTRMTTFPEQLSDSTSLKVYYERFDLPLRSLFYNDYSNSEPKIFIYESAERFIPIRFHKPHRTEFSKQNKNVIKDFAKKSIETTFPENAELNYNMLLTRSYFTTHIYSFINTFKFDHLGYISKQTPVYILDEEEPWLFSYDQIYNGDMSFYYNHSQEEIDNYCDNIRLLANALKERYNFHMVFMPIPSKYTIYHKLLNEDEYNNFLPRMYEALEARNIPVIKLYDDFDNSEDLLYYPTDTHWTHEGLQIALGSTIDMIDSLKATYNLYPETNTSN